MTALWDSYLSKQDLAVLRRGGFGARMGFGQHAAMVVIDAQKYMVGEEGHDETWPSSCGETGRKAVAAIARVVQAGQQASVPCFFTRFEVERDGSDIGGYRRKRDLLSSEHWCLAGSLGAQLVDELHPAAGDVIFVKKKPSGFHGTPLLGYLIDRGIDTVIVMGGATSNCIRATVFDSASYNFRTIVPQECVFDRIPVSHAISLFDMDRQFADVVHMQQVLDYLQPQTAKGVAGHSQRVGS
ncbi:MAG: isochorismatase family protein [Paralcaligenes sp.]